MVVARRRLAIRLLVTLSAALLAGPVTAHDTGSTGAPTFLGVLGSWGSDPLPWLLCTIAAIGYLIAVRRINQAHPLTPVPSWRVVSWLLGVSTVLVALVSPLDTFADELLTIHMVQHLLLTMVAVPLLALGMPVTIALRAATPAIRTKALLPVLQSRVVRVAGLPILGWFIFAAVMVVTHFSPIYEAALGDPLIHEAEHVALVLGATLFWWPIVAADPMPHRLRHGGRLVSLLAMMPVMSAVGLAIYFAHDVLYEHYALIDRAWEASALIDQQVGGLLMWAASDLVMLLAVALVVADWMRADEQRQRVLDLRRAGTARPG